VRQTSGALARPVGGDKSGGGPPQSKTLSRWHKPHWFMVPMRDFEIMEATNKKVQPVQAGFFEGGNADPARHAIT
jgi:hypothetical protein